MFIRKLGIALKAAIFYVNRSTVIRQVTYLGVLFKRILWLSRYGILFCHVDLLHCSKLIRLPVYLIPYISLLVRGLQPYFFLLVDLQDSIFGYGIIRRMSVIHSFLIIFLAIVLNSITSSQTLLSRLIIICFLWIAVQIIFELLRQFQMYNKVPEYYYPCFVTI